MAVPTSVFFNNRFVHRFAAPCLALGLSVFAEAVAAVDLSKIESAALDRFKFLRLRFLC